MAWAWVGEDGKLRRGSGAAPGLVRALASAKAATLSFPGLPPIYFARGPDLMWTVEKIVSAAPRAGRRFWGLAAPAGSRLWPWPDGSMIGVGAELEDVEAAVKLIAEAL